MTQAKEITGRLSRVWRGNFSRTNLCVVLPCPVFLFLLFPKWSLFPIHRAPVQHLGWYHHTLVIRRHKKHLLGISTYPQMPLFLPLIQLFRTKRVTKALPMRRYHRLFHLARLPLNQSTRLLQSLRLVRFVKEPLLHRPRLPHLLLSRDQKSGNRPR